MCYVGIDLGGSSIKAVAVAADGSALGRARRPTPGGSAEAVLTAMAEAGREAAGRRRIAGVGAALPGVVDMAQGEALFLPNLPGDWHKRPVTLELGARLQAPVALLNDVRAAAYGELRVGAGRGCRDFVMLAVGTGIGGAIVVGGELFLGSTAMAGEVGHQVIDRGGPACGCGRRGCAEALAAGPALAARAAAAMTAGRSPQLQRLSNGDPEQVTPRLVAEAAAAGDATASDLLAAEAELLGTVAANLVVVLNPQRVIVGGGVALSGEPLLAGIRRTLRQQIGWYLDYAPVQVVAAALGDEAGALGAGLWSQRLAGDTTTEGVKAP